MRELSHRDPHRKVGEVAAATTPSLARALLFGANLVVETLVTQFLHRRRQSPYAVSIIRLLWRHELALQVRPPRQARSLRHKRGLR
jgi:hypothetical protein